MQSSDESELDNDNGKGPNEIGEELDYPNTGRFIRRCVHPFVSVTNILAVAREYVRPGIGPKVRMTREEARRYSRNCAMIMRVCPQLEELLMKGGIVPHSISNEIKTGMRAARGSDAGILKNNVLRFAPPNGVIFPQSLDVKTSRGFNSDETGRMLVPVEFLEDYDKNPAEIRAKINAGHVNYRVTGGQSPAFLYEDPTEYRPFHIMDGFMRGYYLVRCFRAVYLGRRNAMNHPSTSSSTPQTGVTKKYALTTVTVPMIVYIAVLARFSLSSQEKWSSRDGLFDYDKFADTLLGMFELDEEWTADTLSWWNEQVFGDKDGVVSIVSASDPASGMLADARAQIAQRRADQEADQATPLPAQPRKELTPMSPLSERRETPPAHEDDSDEEGSRGVRSRKRTARELPNGGDSDRDGSDEERSRGGPSRKRTVREVPNGGDSDRDDSDEERSRGGPSRKRTTCEVPGGDDSDEQRRDIRNAKSHKKLHKRPQPAQQCPQKTRSQRRHV